MERLRVNFVGGMVENDPLTIGATTMTSQALAALPLVTLGTNYVPIILDPDGINGEPEVVWITEHAQLGQSATIQREPAGEGSSAREHNNDTYWIHGPTAFDWNNTLTVIHTDGNTGRTVYIGSIDPDVSYTLVDGDIWIEVV